MALTYKCIDNLAPKYLCDLVSPYVPHRALRSQNSALLSQVDYRLLRYGGRALVIEHLCDGTHYLLISELLQACFLLNALLRLIYFVLLLINCSFIMLPSFLVLYVYLFYVQRIRMVFN